MNGLENIPPVVSAALEVALPISRMIQVERLGKDDPSIMKKPFPFELFTYEISGLSPKHKTVEVRFDGYLIMELKLWNSRGLFDTAKWKVTHLEAYFNDPDISLKERMKQKRYELDSAFFDQEEWWLKSLP